MNSLVLGKVQAKMGLSQIAMKVKILPNIKAIITKFREKEIFTLAAAVAFNAFLSVFPFLIMLLYVSSLFLKETVTVEKIRLYLRLFPPSVIDTIIANLENILKSGEILSLISFAFLIYLAFKVFSHLEQALDKIFSVDKKIESWKATLKAFFFFLLTSFVLLASFFTGNTFLVLAANLGKIPFVHSYAVILVVHAAVETFFFAISYKFLSRRKLSFKGVLVGSITATILWEVLKHIFGVYIVRIKIYSVIYGSIGSLVLLMLWLYYSILVYLIGAEIAMEWE
jgi:membrane protein